MGSRQSCSARMGGGSCEGSYKKLSGTYSADNWQRRLKSRPLNRVALLLAAIAVQAGPNSKDSLRLSNAAAAVTSQWAGA
jgi:hypothetical protein